MAIAYFLTFTTYGTWLHGTGKSLDRSIFTITPLVRLSSPGMKCTKQLSVMR